MVPAFLTIDEPSRTPVPPRGFALWQLGFRPFYLLASTFAAASIALWGAQMAGWLGTTPYLPGAVWHAHEMLFGFTLAVVAGFLFTAVRNWTGQPTPTGLVLASIAAIWVAARVLVLTPWPLAAGIANVAFPLAVAAGIGVPILRSGNRRNLFFVGLMLLMALAAALVHLGQAGAIALGAGIGLDAALGIVLFVMTVMAGRVVPMFTANAVPGSKPGRHPAIERLPLGSTLALVAADVAQLPALLLMVLLAVCCAAHLARLWLWQPWTTLRVPLVWVLHAAYLWIPVHLALRLSAEAGLVPASLAIHALTVGAIGGLTIGMMTRTARGHTARPLAADRWDVVAYLLVLAAALVRVVAPIAAPAGYLEGIVASAALWSAGFGVYAVRYWPVLTRPRLDGKPG
jgi:uncharacterized protein involved in response to NO